MKNKLLLLIVCVISLVSPAAKSAVNAADWGVGMMSNIAWWQPSFRSEYENFEIDPLLMWGPVISATVDTRWNFSIIILQNVVNKGSSSFEHDFYGSQGNGTIRVDSEVSRFDMDITAGYAVTGFFKVFLGYKLFTFDFFPAEVTVTEGAYLIHGNKSDSNVGGPQLWGNSAAMGAGLSVPLSSGLSLVVNSSLMYSYLVVGINLFPEKTSGDIQTEANSFNYRGIGANTTLSVSYFIAPMNSVVSIGGRFQVISYQAQDDAPELANDYFYGILISAMYLF